MGELKVYVGSNICYYTFIISFLLQTANTQKSEEFLKERWMHQEFLLADALKFTKNIR